MKILFIFGSPVSFEVFTESGIIETLEHNSEIEEINLALRKNSERTSPDKSRIKNQKIDAREFLASRRQDRFFNLLKDFEFIKNRRNSVAFSRRLSRKFFGNFQTNYLGRRALLVYAKNNLKNPYNFFLLLGYIPILSSAIQSVIKILYPYPFELESILKDFSPNRVILMSTGMEPCLFEIPVVTKKLNIEWDLIVDNWDNLSSKTIFWEKPAHIYVWGKDHFNYAINSHGFNPSQVYEVGTPRITFPMKSNNRSIENDLVLYAGMQKPYDEISDLGIILEHCNSESRHLIYRPHPMRKFNATERRLLASLLERNNFHINFSENFRNYIPNSSLNEISAKDEFTNLSKESLLLMNFRNVIATPTSLALESLIYGHSIIMVARNDGIYRTTSSSYWDLYPYFEPLKKMKAIRVARDHEDLIAMLKSPQESKFDEQSREIIEEEICKSGKENWTKLLLNAIIESN
jgi:hypothetical protein